jgi:hypothetical protein
MRYFKIQILIQNYLNIEIQNTIQIPHKNTVCKFMYIYKHVYIKTYIKKCQYKKRTLSGVRGSWGQ